MLPDHLATPATLLQGVLGQRATASEPSRGCAHSKPQGASDWLPTGARKAEIWERCTHSCNWPGTTTPKPPHCLEGIEFGTISLVYSQESCHEAMTTFFFVTRKCLRPGSIRAHRRNFSKTSESVKGIPRGIAVLFILWTINLETYYPFPFGHLEAHSPIPCSTFRMSIIVMGFFTRPFSFVFPS